MRGTGGAAQGGADSAAERSGLHMVLAALREQRGMAHAAGSPTGGVLHAAVSSGSQGMPSR